MFDFWQPAKHWIYTLAPKTVFRVKLFSLSHTLWLGSLDHIQWDEKCTSHLCIEHWIMRMAMFRHFHSKPAIFFNGRPSQTLSVSIWNTRTEKERILYFYSELFLDIALFMRLSYILFLLLFSLSFLRRLFDYVVTMSLFVASLVTSLGLMCNCLNIPSADRSNCVFMYFNYKAWTQAYDYEITSSAKSTWWLIFFRTNHESEA